MNLDLNRIFPIIDAPSARLMEIKAECLFEAGIITAAQKTQIELRDNKIECIPSPIMVPQQQLELSPNLGDGRGQAAA